MRLPTRRTFFAKLRQWQLLLAMPLLGGCTFKLDVYSSSCINPDAPPCRDDKRDSRQLEYRVYQLKDHENVQSVLDIPWEAFRSGGKIPDEVKPFLAVTPETPVQLRPREDFSILRRQHETVSIKLVRDARYLLIVSRGHQPGENTQDHGALRLIKIEPFKFNQSLCIHLYELYLKGSSWPCERWEDR